MMTMPGTPTPDDCDLHGSPAYTQRTARVDILRERQTSMGLGSYAGMGNAQDQFGLDNDFEHAASSGLGGFGGMDRPVAQPFAGYARPHPVDTWIVFHQGDGMSHFYVQAKTRLFIALFMAFMGIVVILINAPGLGELLLSVVKSLLNAR